MLQEDKSAEIALDPDSAVVNSATGHQEQEKERVVYLKTEMHHIRYVLEKSNKYTLN